MGVEGILFYFCIYLHTTFLLLVSVKVNMRELNLRLVCIDFPVSLFSQKNIMKSIKVIATTSWNMLFSFCTTRHFTALNTLHKLHFLFWNLKKLNKSVFSLELKDCHLQRRSWAWPPIPVCRTRRSASLRIACLESLGLLQCRSP